MKKVLIVEDEDTYRSALRESLKEEGYDCEEAKDGIEGLHKLGLFEFDLVITDLHMPLLNGRDFIQKMSEHHQWKSIPVICLTGNLDSFPMQVGRPVTILTKPIEFKLLLTILHDFFNTEG